MGSFSDRTTTMQPKVCSAVYVLVSRDRQKGRSPVSSDRPALSWTTISIYYGMKAQPC
jgi:hypothetical protein